MTVTARNLDLEAQIAKAPRDASVFAVYADWLVEHDDPRGELITTVLALEGDPDNRELRARANALHDAHDATWLGPLAHPEIAVKWRRGFVDAVAFGRRTPALSGARIAALYADLRARPICALVRDLAFGPIFDGSEEPDYDEVVTAIAREGAPATVRRLAFEPGPWLPYQCDAGSLVPLYAAVPKLHVLRVAMRCSFGETIALPNLRELDAYVPALRLEDEAALRTAHWPKLVSLTLRYGIDEYPAASSTNAPDSVLDRSFDALSKLAVTGWIAVDAFVRWLADAAFVRQLRVLDLSYSRISDEIVEAIAEKPDAFRGLERLVLTGARLSPGAVAALRDIVPGVLYEDDDD